MLEIIAPNSEEAKIIQDCGGDRIELVSALSEGGLTPSYGIIKEVIKSVSIPVNVIIRPHSRSFVYSEGDIRAMESDIKLAKDLGANGIVIGALDEKNNIDIKAIEKLIAFGEGLEITFHRAIDEMENLVDAVKLLAKYKEITNILTSGGKGSIVDNISTLRRMADVSDHIRILAGGGLNLDNISNFIQPKLDLDFHFGTAVRAEKSSQGLIEKEKLNHLRTFI